MNSIPEMIQVLRGNPVLLGLAEYGGASSLDERIDGDYDLIVIVDRRLPDVESLHFYVDGTPVDLNIRSLEQIRAMDRADGFESILLDARVIHDPTGQVGRVLRELRDRHMAAPTPAIEPGKIAAMRHGARHTFDKLRTPRHLPLTLKRYMLHQCVYWALPQYFEIRGLQYRGEKHGLAFLRENDPDLYDRFEEFYATADPDEQARLARAIQDAVLSPVGGLWRHDELLTFGDQSRGKETFRLLFGDAGTPVHTATQPSIPPDTR